MQVSFLAFLGPFNSAVVNPALVPLTKLFHVPVTDGPYQTTTVIVAVGVAPLFWTPLANIYGRRPIYIISMLIGIGATIGSGAAKTWSTLIVARAFSGKHAALFETISADSPRYRLRKCHGDRRSHRQRHLLPA